MRKEIIICIIVVILIVVLNIITQNNTETVMDKIIENLTRTSQAIKEENEEQIISNVNEANKEWEEKKEKLGLYIEHNELEKVGLYMQEINTNIGRKEYNMAMESLDTCTYIIEHIKEKYKLTVVNIF